MQGSLEVARLCGCSAENDSARKKKNNFEGGGVWSVLFPFPFFFLLPFFYLLRSPAACPALLFCCFIATSYHIHSLWLRSILFISLCQSLLLAPPPLHRPIILRIAGSLTCRALMLPLVCQRALVIPLQNIHAAARNRNGSSWGLRLDSVGSSSCLKDD